MLYRLPLELELTILELATPTLEIDSLHARVDFFIKISLVHRSLTAWAQDKLRDQFLYTYRPREDEYERLKKRLEAGFGRDRPLRRLYLDLTRLPKEVPLRTESDTDSVSVPIEVRASGASLPIDRSSISAQDGARTPKHEVVRFIQHEGANLRIGYWEMCAMVTGHSQALDTLWLKPPVLRLDLKNLPPPRILYVDDEDYDGTWGYFGSLPVSSKTALFLRKMNLGVEGDWSDLSALDLRQVVFDQSYSMDVNLCVLLVDFRRLETLVISEGGGNDTVTLAVMLPVSIQRVHLLQHTFYIEENQPDDPHDLPHLESFTFTWIADRTPAEEDSDSLTHLRRAIESNIVAPQCTFKYLRSTKSPASALADALAELGLDS